MNVLHIITSLNFGGAEKLVIDSLPLYNMNKMDVDLLLLSNKYSGFNNINENSRSGQVFNLSNGSVYNPFLIFKIIPFLKKYDLVHVHLFPTLYWVVLAKIVSLSKVKIVYTEHSTSNRRRENFIFKIFDRIIYSYLDFIGCISNACYLNLKNHLKYKKDTIKVVNNGIKINDIESVPSLTEFFFKKNSFVLIQISSFRMQKDQKTVINALRYLPDEIVLLLVGDGILRKECEELVKSFGLGARVVFTGNRDDVFSLLKYSDLAIQSSEYEGFGLAAVEAMSMGKGVIASNVDGLNEVVKDFGVLFPKGDSLALAKEVLKIYDNVIYRSEIESKCKLRASDFNIEEMVKEYVYIYKMLLNDKVI